MRDWEQYVRSHLRASELTPERESRIVRELAAQLEDFYREARARGDGDVEADAFARRQIADWTELAASIRHADGPHVRSRVARWTARIDERDRSAAGHWTVLGDLWRDVRYARRQLARRPGFIAVAALTLALGIGANVAIFSVVYGVLLKPLPFVEAERLVGVYHAAPSINLPVMNHGPATYFTYRDTHRVFEDIGAWESDEVSITGRGQPERVEVLTVTHTLLPLLRVQPAYGRLFSNEDDEPGAPLRVVLSHQYWQRKFQGSRAVVGQALGVDGRPAEVIGVLPASFKFLRDADVLLAMRLNRATAFSGMEFDFQAIARLKRGVTLAHANADLARMIPLLPKPHDTLRLQPNVRPLAEDLIGEVREVLWILLGAVGIVLLIACANVANLFLVRAEGRQQELAVRAALGASRTRLARELLSESLLLSVLAGALGLLFTKAAIGVLRRMAPPDLPRVDEIGVDPIVWLFALGLSLLTGAVFGLLPVLRFGSPNVALVRDGGRTVSDAPARHRTRNILVVAEVALAIVLMVSSGLMVRTFIAMQRVHPGFERPAQVQTFRIAVPDALISDVGQFARTHEQILDRLRHVPGVMSAGLSSSITMDGEDNANPLFVENVFVAEGQWPPLRRFKTVAPGYFETMGNPLQAGRFITWQDIHERRRVVIVSETLAQEFWRSASAAVGKRVRNSHDTGWYEIVGVVGNERDDGLNKPATAIVYWPMLSDAYMPGTMAYAVRSHRIGEPGFLRELQQAVWSVNSQLPLASVRTLDDIQAASMAQTAFTMVMLVMAATIALLLGGVGLYAVIAYVAAQRTREIGIRMALGARGADVLRMLLIQGMTLTAIGILIGVAGALGVTRVMRALLYATSPTDAMTFIAGILLVFASAVIACSVPARRAMRADPTVALRYQ